MLRLFYDECVDTLTQPLAQLPGPPASAYLQDKGAAIYAVLELLTVFVAQHAHYMKTHLLRSTIVVKATQLLNCNRAYLALGMCSAPIVLSVDIWLHQVLMHCSFSMPHRGTAASARFGRAEG